MTAGLAPMAYAAATPIPNRAIEPIILRTDRSFRKAAGGAGVLRVGQASLQSSVAGMVWGRPRNTTPQLCPPLTPPAHVETAPGAPERNDPPIAPQLEGEKGEKNFE